MIVASPSIVPVRAAPSDTNCENSSVKFQSYRPVREYPLRWIVNWHFRCMPTTDEPTLPMTV